MPHNLDETALYLLKQVLHLYVVLAETCANLPDPILLDRAYGLSGDHRDAVTRVAQLAAGQDLPEHQRDNLIRACGHWLATEHLTDGFMELPRPHRARAAALHVALTRHHLVELMRHLNDRKED